MVRDILEINPEGGGGGTERERGSEGVMHKDISLVSCGEIVLRRFGCKIIISTEKQVGLILNKVSCVLFCLVLLFIFGFTTMTNLPWPNFLFFYF